MMIIGATIYALEIPNYFKWIQKKTSFESKWKVAAARTGLALAYFNPLWISRHLLFIALVSGRFDGIGLNLLTLGGISFLYNIPAAVIGNFIIQVKLPLRLRFVGSAIFSALLAVYYAMSEVLFDG